MKTKTLGKILLSCSLLLFLQSCMTIKQGEVGVKRKFGKYSDTGYTEGLKVYNPLVSRIVKIPIRTENIEVTLNIPSREGLNILSEVSILYNVNPKEAPELLRNIGTDYEENVILPVFRSSVSDVSAKYFAKDMHTGERSNIEQSIKDRMMTYLGDKGIRIESVLLKSIKLPRSLSAAIEEKLEAEQKAERMKFVINQTVSEAEQKIIEAKGIRDAQLIISEGLDEKILQFKSIEAFTKLASSPNTKVIISDGDMPMIMGENGLKN